MAIPSQIQSIRPSVLTALNGMQTPPPLARLMQKTMSSPDKLQHVRTRQQLN